MADEKPPPPGAPPPSWDDLSDTGRAVALHRAQAIPEVRGSLERIENALRDVAKVNTQQDGRIGAVEKAVKSTTTDVGKLLDLEKERKGGIKVLTWGGGILGVVLLGGLGTVATAVWDGPAERVADQARMSRIEEKHRDHTETEAHPGIDQRVQTVERNLGLLKRDQTSHETADERTRRDLLDRIKRRRR